MAEPQVVVIGGGPAGLAAAATLGQYGIETLLVERRAEPPTLPRATALSTRSMELVRGWGLEAEVRAGGVDADVWLWEGSTLAAVAEGRAHPVGYPDRHQAGVVSPSPPAVVPQDRFEAVLRRHLGSVPSVRVELGAEVVDLAVEPGAVDVVVRGADGRTRTVEAAYVVAADGAHSPTRQRLGVAMDDRGGAYVGLQVVFRAPLWRLLGDHRYALYSVAADGAPGLFLPAGPGDRWIYGPAQEHPVDGSGAPERAWLVDAIRRGAGVDDLDVRIERTGPFSSPGQIAERFRVGRVLLAGDAAHRMTPRGGTGMNIALQGGHDLGWKLAWTLLGWAGPDLLDTYEGERRLVAEHDLARSVDPDGSRRAVADELPVDLGGRLRHVWLGAYGDGGSTLDLLAPGWTLFTGPVPGSWAASAASSPVPISVRAVDPLVARSIGVHGDGALLARPDGVPVALWPSYPGLVAVRRTTQAHHAPRRTPADTTRHRARVLAGHPPA